MKTTELESIYFEWRECSLLFTKSNTSVKNDTNFQQIFGSMWHTMINHLPISDYH